VSNTSKNTQISENKSNCDKNNSESQNSNVNVISVNSNAFQKNNNQNEVLVENHVLEKKTVSKSI